MRALRVLHLLFPLYLTACGASGPDGQAPLGPNPPVTTPIANPSGAPTEPTPDPKSQPLPMPPSGKHVGATPLASGAGVEFRVWAPNATRAFVKGAEIGRTELAKESGGYFGGRVDVAHAGHRYRFELTTADGQTVDRMDPRARMVAGGEAVVVDPRTYTWKSKSTFTPSARERSVIYEMHIGSFHAPKGPSTGNFIDAIAKLDALQELGVDAVELMPINLHGSHGWGYNPQLYFAPHESFGTPDDIRAFVDAAHERGIAVILDIVFNHYDGWSQAPLRCFDASATTCGSGTHGIYFFENEPYKKTPWGPRPDFSKKEVSDFFADNIFFWMNEYRIDGFRHDSVSNVRAIDGQGTVPGGADLLRRLNVVAKDHSPASLLVAEDLKGHAPITLSIPNNGLGFDTQWDGGFHWAVTGAAVAANDDARDLAAVRNTLLGTYNNDPFQRLLYVESHDTAGNDHGNRLPFRIDSANPTSLAARRRTMLAAGVLLTAPGVPMLFMGQEMLNTTKFAVQPAPLDWASANANANAGVLSFHRDMIRLRRNLDGSSAGLSSKNITVTHLNDTQGNKVIAYRRDNVMVIANFGGKKYTRYDIGLPSGGAWVARMDSDSVRYGSDLGGAQEPTAVTNVVQQARDGLPFMGAITLGAYSIVVLTPAN